MTDTRIYEIGYLMLPTIPEDKIAGSVGDLKGELERRGAIFISDENPRIIRLAYPMDKVIENKRQHFDTAYFGWVKFELEPANLATVEAYLKASKEILRFLAIKTIRENTVIGRRFVPKRVQKIVEAKVEMTPMVVEEIDKKIEELAI